jgi:hypothetical protein
VTRFPYLFRNAALPVASGGHTIDNVGSVGSRVDVQERIWTRPDLWGGCRFSRWLLASKRLYLAFLQSVPQGLRIRQRLESVATRSLGGTSEFTIRRAARRVRGARILELIGRAKVATLADLSARNLLKGKEELVALTGIEGVWQQFGSVQLSPTDSNCVQLDREAPAKFATDSRRCHSVVTRRASRLPARPSVSALDDSTVTPVH